MFLAIVGLVVSVVAALFAISVAFVLLGEALDASDVPSWTATSVVFVIALLLISLSFWQPLHWVGIA